uniref:Uncharacterized protein n=1 Tax=Anguilla anguilla TaxID=7936 RepID=A0A0E9UN95_ANGAN
MVEPMRLGGVSFRPFNVVTCSSDNQKKRRKTCVHNIPKWLFLPVPFTFSCGWELLR